MCKNAIRNETLRNPYNERDKISLWSVTEISKKINKGFWQLPGRSQHFTLAQRSSASSRIWKVDSEIHSAWRAPHTLIGDNQRDDAGASVQICHFQVLLKIHKTQDNTVLTWIETMTIMGGTWESRNIYVEHSYQEMRIECVNWHTRGRRQRAAWSQRSQMWGVKY